MQPNTAARIAAIATLLTVALAAFSVTLPPFSGITVIVVMLSVIGVAAATVAARGGDLA